jgi:hypothetical protein
MLKHLISDDEIEGIRFEDFPTDVVLRIVSSNIGLERKLAAPLRSRRDFQDIQGRGIKAADEPEALFVHHHANPVGGFEAHLIKGASGVRTPIPS